MQQRRIILAVPHGFCAGVERAIAVAEAVLRERPKPVYCLREIVHNGQVIEDLTRRGIVFVPEIDLIPPRSTVLFSAHGVAPAIRAAAAARQLEVIDATCPFVGKVHTEVRRFAREGCSILLIGTRRHDEVIGVAGEAPDRVTVLECQEDARAVAPPNPARVAAITQTTLSVEETDRVLRVLRSRFPRLRLAPQTDICYATTNRQEAVRAVARKADLVVVLGAENSSNSNRLVEVAKAEGCAACLASATNRLSDLSLEGVSALGLTSGASTPERLVREAISWLRQRGFEKVEELVTAREDLHFTLPQRLDTQRGWAAKDVPAEKGD